MATRRKIPPVEVDLVPYVLYEPSPQSVPSNSPIHSPLPSPRIRRSSIGSGIMTIVRSVGSGLLKVDISPPTSPIVVSPKAIKRLGLSKDEIRRISLTPRLDD